MEKLYQEYRDIAEFRLIYIQEAHAADGRRPVPYAKELGITEHDDHQERCVTAEMLLKDKRLTIPCLIDEMDNRCNEAYHAFPDRIFVVRRDGRLGVAADKGPSGFKPALEETERWLKALRETNSEPELTPEQTAALQKKTEKGSETPLEQKKKQTEKDP